MSARTGRGHAFDDPHHRGHSQMCVSIGGGPGHDHCVCWCHGTDEALQRRLDEWNRVDGYPPATDWRTRCNDAYWLGWRDSQLAMQRSAAAAVPSTADPEPEHRHKWVPPAQRGDHDYGLGPSGWFCSNCGAVPSTADGEGEGQ